MKRHTKKGEMISAADSSLTPHADSDSEPVKKKTWLSINCGLHEPQADADGLYGGCYHPIEQSRVVQGMSWWGLGSGLLGISQGKVVMGSVVCVAAFIAYAYWWRPKNNWRRWLDMLMIQVLLWWHMYAALELPGSFKAWYFAITVCGALFYALSWVTLKRGETWLGVIMHMALTACANLSLFTIYSAPCSRCS